MYSYVYFGPCAEKIPIKYNHYLQSAIYHLLPPKYSQFLHDVGYVFGKRRYRMFSFSRLLGPYELDLENKTIGFPQGCMLIISSADNEFLKQLMNQFLTKRKITVGTIDMAVKKIQFKNKQPMNQSIVVNTVSPVTAYCTIQKPDGRKYTTYFSPGSVEFERIVAQNLKRKYAAYYGEKEFDNVSIEVIGKPRLEVVKYKGIFVNGYLSKFRLNGPAELLKVALDSGLGDKNAQGFGCVIPESYDE